MPFNIRFAAGMIMRVTYGHKVKSNDDKFVRLGDEASEMTVQSGGYGAMLVDFFPLRTSVQFLYYCFREYLRQLRRQKSQTHSIMDARRRVSAQSC